MALQWPVTPILGYLPPATVLQCQINYLNTLALLYHMFLTPLAPTFLSTVLKMPMMEAHKFKNLFSDFEPCIKKESKEATLYSCGVRKSI